MLNLERRPAVFGVVEQKGERSAGRVKFEEPGTWDNNLLGDVETWRPGESWAMINDHQEGAAPISAVPSSSLFSPSFALDDL